MPDGARLAAERNPELVIFDGSGAALPPIASERRVLVVGAHQDPAVVTGYLNAYRILISDLVVLTMAEEGAGHETLKRAIEEVKPSAPVIASVLRPRPVASIEGRSIAFFTTAPEAVHGELARHLQAEHGAEQVSVSGNLAKRDALRADLERAEADLYLVEIKAAAIDVVAETASEQDVEVIFADNEVCPLEGEPDLDAALRALADAALAERAVRSP